MRLRTALAGVTALAALPVVSELRLARPEQPLTSTWQQVKVHPRGSTVLGVSWRSPQVDEMGLEQQTALRQVLQYPFEMIRLGAYWNRIEPAPGQFDASELDAQVEAAERAGKQILLAVGAVKTFGYPEFFVPRHRLARPIREGSLVRTNDHAWLLDPALEFAARVVERYRDSSAIVAWQIEHEAVDPLGLEHSWRLSGDFVASEIAAVKRADPRQRPILLNGFLPMSILVALQQWWRTRDQGDSLAFAIEMADIVGLDVYPCHGLTGIGPLSSYLEGGRWLAWLRSRIIAATLERGKRVMVSEGQAEPWEVVRVPPSPSPSVVMFSGTPERMIRTYNACMRWTPDLYAYLFWGAEYWLHRAAQGDGSYLNAFARILEQK